jgi:hypothetical protein
VLKGGVTLLEKISKEDQGKIYPLDILRENLKGGTKEYFLE